MKCNPVVQRSLDLSVFHLKLLSLAGPLFDTNIKKALSTSLNRNNGLRHHTFVKVAIFFIQLYN